MRRRPSPPFLLASVLSLLGLGTAGAEPLARPAPYAGLIVSAKGGEEFLPVHVPGWRAAEARQDLLSGDTLRTNAIGTLALLFADQTQVRVGRNSTLVVKDVATNGPAALGLSQGNVWARAARGGASLTIDTPAAAAAIRGTDWSLTVDGNKTSLMVLEGTVELVNAQGSVTVHEGEAAVATLGSKPTKVVLVRPKDREQMLFYLSLRDAFGWLPATSGDRRAEREERARLLAQPADRRSAEDWLRLAETGLAYDGWVAAAADLARARSRPLTASQQARADLVEALIASAQQHWKEAAVLFRRAERRGLDPARRTSALYGAAFAEALADPGRTPALPAGEAARGPTGAIAQAWIAGFTKDVDASLAIVRTAQDRYPDDITLAAARARLAILAGSPQEAEAAAARAMAIDPGDPLALQADAYVLFFQKNDLDGALATLARAAEIAPGDSDVWNSIGLVQDERDAPREAEQAFRQAIVVAPDNPVARANYAILLLDQSRVEEARSQIDTVMTLDPSLAFGYTALGRYYLQTGETDKALENLLAGSVANPAYSNGVLALAIGYYQADQVEPALQQLDAAARLDPNDPVVSQVRTAIALDRFEADQAITSARETLAKIRARGGVYAPLAAAKDAGSYLSDSFRLLDLDAWGRYYGDVTFDPFRATSYFDQAINTRNNPLFIPSSVLTPAIGEETDAYAYSSFMQGLLLDPLAVSGRNRRIDLVRRPFLDSEIGGGLVWRDGKLGWSASATMQGFSNLPVPVAYSVSVAGLDTSGQRQNDEESSVSASLFVGANPTPYDHVVLFSLLNKADPSLPKTDLPVLPGIDVDIDRSGVSALSGVGWGHVFGDRNILTTAAVASYGRDIQSGSLSVLGIPLSAFRQRDEQTTGLVAASHLYGLGPATIRYGAEISVADIDTSGVGTLTGATTLSMSRAYIDVLAPIGEHIRVEAGAYGAFQQSGAQDINHFDPRIGVAVEPFDGHWLRAAYRRDTQFPISFTLSPVATLGLLPNLAPLDVGGRADSTILRWDAEWGSRLFTAVEYQHQALSGVNMSVPQSLDEVALDSARIDRLSATANLWLGGGFGLFALAAWSNGQDKSANPQYDGDVPFLPERFGRVGLTWVSPEQITLTVAQTFVGERLGVRLGFPSETLDAYTTTDVTFSWQPFERRLAFDASILNLFDRNFELAPGTPAPGRTVLGSMKLRF